MAVVTAVAANALRALVRSGRPLRGVKTGGRGDRRDRGVQTEGIARRESRQVGSCREADTRARVRVRVREPSSRRWCYTQNASGADWSAK